MFRTVTALALIMLPGVVDAKKRPTLRDQIAVFYGQPLSVASGRLGIPTGKMEMGDATVYSWHRGNVFSGYATDEQPLECTVRLSVDAGGIVRQGDVDGNKGACDLFSKKLR